MERLLICILALLVGTCSNTKQERNDKISETDSLLSLQTDKQLIVDYIKPVQEKEISDSLMYRLFIEGKYAEISDGHYILNNEFKKAIYTISILNTRGTEQSLKCIEDINALDISYSPNDGYFRYSPLSWTIKVDIYKRWALFRNLSVRDNDVLHESRQVLLMDVPSTNETGYELINLDYQLERAISTKKQSDTLEDLFRSIVKKYPNWIEKDYYWFKYKMSIGDYEQIKSFLASRPLEELDNRVIEDIVHLYLYEDKSSFRNEASTLIDYLKSKASRNNFSKALSDYYYLNNNYNEAANEYQKGFDKLEFYSRQNTLDIIFSYIHSCEETGEYNKALEAIIRFKASNFYYQNLELEYKRAALLFESRALLGVENIDQLKKFITLNKDQLSFIAHSSTEKGIAAYVYSINMKDTVGFSRFYQLNWK